MARIGYAKFAGVRQKKQSDCAQNSQYNKPGGSKRSRLSNLDTKSTIGDKSLSSLSSTSSDSVTTVSSLSLDSPLSKFFRSNSADKKTSPPVRVLSEDGNITEPVAVKATRLTRFQDDLIANVGPVMRVSLLNGKAVYEGEFDYNGEFDGFGALVTTDFIYVGEWQDGRPHGYGVYICCMPNLKYEGEFRKGEAHGYGRLVTYGSSSEDFFYGKFNNGNQILGKGSGKIRSKSVAAMSQGRKCAALALSSVSPKMQANFVSLTRKVESILPYQDTNVNSVSYQFDLRSPQPQLGYGACRMYSAIH